MKKILVILIVTLLITTTFQTISSIGEVKDQYQEQSDECEYFENYAWQQFVPSLAELTRVEVFIAETGELLE